MQRHALNWRRAAVILGAAAILAAVVAPASAFARIATRILVTSTRSSVVYTTDWSQPGTVPVAPVATARLQQKTRYGWKTLKGTIYVYRNDSSNDTLTQFTFLKSYAASTVRYALGTRGKYKFWFKGSRTLAPSIAYSTRQDYIGDSLTMSTPSITSTDGVWTNVSVLYTVSWNAPAAYPMVTDSPLYLDFEGTFENTDKTTYSGNVDMFQDFWDPGEVLVTYRVRNIYVLPILQSDPTGTFLDTTAYVKSVDPYVVTRSKSIERTLFTLP